jgi:putative ABC transport system ATP-binding protein
MKHLLQINNLNFSLPNGRVLLENINIAVTSGEFIMLLGHNGSGKSTLIKLINQQYLFREGEILLNNISIKKIKHKHFAKRVITLSQFVQDSLFNDLSVLDNAKMITPISSASELKNYLSDFNLNLVKALNNRVEDLSGGEQQQLMFALYMTLKPELLLLDEHTSALDPQNSLKLMQMTLDYVRKNKITCLMTTHNMQFAELGTRVIRMENGTIRESGVVA